MTEFSTTASLYVELEQSSLRGSRKKLENELTADPIQVEVEPVKSPGSAMDGLNNSGQRGGGRGGGGVGGLTETMEDQATVLDDITDSWEENIELNERRNELLEDLQDEIQQGNFDRARRLGSAGGALGGLAIGITLLGVSKLTSTLSNFSWPQLPEAPDIDAPEIPPLDVPDSVPVEVPDTPSLDIPNIPPLDIPDLPEFTWPDLPEFSWPSLPTFTWPNLPDWTWPDLPEFSWPQIPQPDWLPLVGDPDGTDGGSGSGSSLIDDVVSGGETAWDTVAGAGEGAAEWAGENSGKAVAGGSLVAGGLLALADGPLPFGDAAGASVAAAGGGGALLGGLLGGAATGKDSVGDFTQDLLGDDWGSSATGGRRGPRGQGVGPIEGFFSRLYEPLLPNDMQRGGATTTVSSTGGKDPRERYWERRDRDRNRNSGSTTTKAPQVDFNPTYELDTSSLERQVQSDIQDVKNRLSKLEDSFGGRGAGRL